MIRFKPIHIILE